MFRSTEMREKGLKIVLRGLGLLLLTAAVLKGQELLTTPVGNMDIWSNRYFLIFQVEFELALGIWLVSGLFKRVAWLAGSGRAVQKGASDRGLSFRSSVHYLFSTTMQPIDCSFPFL
jgi:hypothetical protein